MGLSILSQKEGLAGADPENSERAGVAAIIDSYIDTVQFTENSIKNAKFHRKEGRGLGEEMGGLVDHTLNPRLCSLEYKRHVYLFNV